MQRKRARLVAIVAAPLLLAIYGSGTARAQIARDYYKGKSVDIIVGYETGGGYDVYARLLARHMGRHLPGQPGVVVKNMPGAVSRAAGNYIASVAAKDGMAIAVRRQNIWLRLGLRLAEFRPHHGVDIKRRSCGAASVDVG